MPHLKASKGFFSITVNILKLFCLEGLLQKIFRVKKKEEEKQGYRAKCNTFINCLQS